LGGAGFVSHEFVTPSSGLESLANWEHSSGKHLAKRDVWIEPKRVKDRVIAMIQDWNEAKMEPAYFVAFADHINAHGTIG
jgi:hypothetical protein